jgi:hypothetical protein
MQKKEKEKEMEKEMEDKEKRRKRRNSRCYRGTANSFKFVNLSFLDTWVCAEFEAEDMQLETIVA